MREHEDGPAASRSTATSLDGSVVRKFPSRRTLVPDPVRSWSLDRWQPVRTVADGARIAMA